RRREQPARDRGWQGALPPRQHRGGARVDRREPHLKSGPAVGSKREPARVSGRATSAAARIKKARATKQATSVKPARAAQATTAAKPTSAETPSHGLSLAELGRAGDFGALAHYAD